MVNLLLAFNQIGTIFKGEVDLTLMLLPVTSLNVGYKLLVNMIPDNLYAMLALMSEQDVSGALWTVTV